MAMKTPMWGANETVIGKLHTECILDFRGVGGVGQSVQGVRARVRS